MKTKFILFAGIAALGVIVTLGGFLAWENSATTLDVPVTVKIPGRNYAFGKYEVTQKQYEAVMKNNPSRFKGEDLPVENVSWNEAVEYCKKLTERERASGRISMNQEYRLPPSDEWKHACRAGTTTKYYTGDSVEDLARAGWYRRNSGRKTHSVGQKLPNAFGLYDMHGNVWEWTSTPFGSNRVSCGGSWINYADGCESSDWYSVSPEDRRDRIGFRVMLSEVEYIWDL